MENQFKNKYLKYKSKYFKMKELFGGNGEVPKPPTEPGCWFYIKNGAQTLNENEKVMGYWVRDGYGSGLSSQECLNKRKEDLMVYYGVKNEDDFKIHSTTVDTPAPLVSIALPDIKPDKVIQQLRFDFFKEFPLNLLIDDLINPLYIAYDIIITEDIYEIIKTFNKGRGTNDKIKLTLEGGNLLGYARYGKLYDNYHFMPWDDDVDLGCFVNRQFNNNDYHALFTKFIEKGYILTTYLRHNDKPASQAWSDHEVVEFGNPTSADDLLSKYKDYKVVIFNVNIPQDKYIDELNRQGIDISRQLYYDEAKKSIIRPSVDMFFYTFDGKENYSNSEYFGFPKPQTYSFKKEYIESLESIRYNNLIDVNIPTGLDEYFTSVYGPNGLNTLYFKKHSTKLDHGIYDKLNEYKIKFNEGFILKLVELYNEQINKYFRILKKN